MGHSHYSNRGKASGKSHKASESPTSSLMSRGSNDHKPIDWLQE